MSGATPGASSTGRTPATRWNAKSNCRLPRQAETKPEGEPEMSTRTALDTVSEYVQALADKNIDRMLSLRAEAYVRDFAHTDIFHRGPVSSEESQRFWHALFTAFPELDYEVSCTLAAEDVVATQWTFTATNSRPVSPPIVPIDMEATGRTVKIRGATFYDVNDGLIERETMYTDLSTLFVELGVNP
ncbi:MAG: hypothetical protein FI707_15445 [SAR202 cluster bacterium]|nr:hypothetical protein [SAR202 cluster bacterium]MQG70171.1 hypothetical protein [SAR202 cluster bacterium]HAL47478.1 hypothetical protein [Dehalococcoidia bacterium]